MHLALAHLGHWYESALFAVPMLVIGGVIWRGARKEQAAGPSLDAWDGEEAWIDPRLSDDDRDEF